ncbi:MAG: ATP-binding cassette domain-containing protein [Mesorhizobium sp.]|uniref:ABC transporter ATP-binding protein n=1 Tax=unclassified Mesorhizobium TaxID=325217 RepID=UPI000F75F5E6|nr:MULTISPECIES: ABC transporter ATP-binding protein [unclassified Mesorhizobium]RVC70913.1 ATP-binding cassette domain-containing protein [Mesorhizobium sp. M00.F.Ca.ET.038.03.1.1]RVC81922.1 ATP-binding cassette domain-containing protein [Mesorhizobium sp. M2A.F.Ca.ET.046.02.1.1]AZO36462.1 ABC transporter ATP-binding protein [Mesorhizobium sp. M2A.F.Ca.ET.046.03.2.1]RWB45036.1 MAG: ATP-binding cassette domain-containing protein [Mesorhizobium sp.]RWE20846.1 MAG: ATP-binding cassette domain-co
MSMLIKTESLTRVLPETIPVTLVKDVTVSIEEREFVAITGPSGSGKSSLLYLLGLLDRPTGGRLTIGGRDTDPMDERERAATRLSMLGFVFQFHFLLPEFTARENVEIPMRKLGRLAPSAMHERSGELLASLGLGEHLDKRPDQLSGGQRQRVAVARSLANDPPLILADEPTGSLDSKSSEQVFAILENLVRERGKTVVAVTHDLEMAGRMDRRIQMVDGKIE